MDARDILLSAKGTRFVDETGKKSYIKLYDPLTDDEIVSLSRALRSPLPTELENLLRCASAFESAIGCIDFSSEEVFFEELFPHGLPIASDGVGNYWVVDLTGETANEAAVYFSCHDPPVNALQAQSIGAFISEVIAYGRQQPNTIKQVTEQSVDTISLKDPKLLSYEACLQGDTQLRQFAELFGDAFEFTDLRNVQVGEGFSWGKYGADTICRRHKTERIFARKKKKLNWFQKIFGA